jgi:hypothetical protein
MNPFILYVDASHAGMACALHRVCTGQGRPPLDDSSNREATAKPMTAEARQDLAKLQQNDPTWTKVRENAALFPQFTMRDGMILWHDESICLPSNKNFISSVLHDSHDEDGEGRIQRNGGYGSSSGGGNQASKGVIDEGADVPLKKRACDGNDVGGKAKAGKRHMRRGRD